MLQNKLYTIGYFKVSDTKDQLSAQLVLNKEHPIFEGHFPGNPILPGVCTVQIIRELLEVAFESELQLTRASNIKYLGFISPLITPEIQFDLTIKTSETGLLNCNATISAGGNTLCSFKGEYQIC